MMRLGDVLPIWRIKKFKKLAPLWREVLHDEKVSKRKQNIPWRTRLWAWRHGFLSESFNIYGLDQNDYREYLSDYARIVHSGGINGRYREILADKLLFSHAMRDFRDHMPKRYGYILRGVPYWFPQYAGTNLEDLCQAEYGIVLKPIRGGSGAGITYIKTHAGRWFINNTPTTSNDVHKHISRLHDFLIEETIEQAEYSSTIFPKTTNTIRLLTMWDFDVGRPFPAAAVHRFGTEASFPVDNWDAGGLCVGVDLEAGTLGSGVTYPSGGQLMYHQRHPDSHSTFTGIQIPNWHAVKNGILEIASAFPYLPYVGWDVLITDDGGFKVIEGNHRSSVQILQLHEPLLRSPRIRTFYERYGVIKPSETST